MAQQPRADHSFAIKCQLIEEVWQWPIIFNKGHPRHAISNERVEEFENIGVAIGKNGE